ncbi:MAG: hypothetical protein COA78_24815 [Blastopirellula sp.]|nr:MAG: hypothetical protein COA78_24815 [Blastopirellula sp.]
MLLGATLAPAADVWQWTPDAEHHKAINAITIGNGGGTGTFCISEATGRKFILTCGHMGNSPGVVHWWDGSTGRLTPLVVIDQVGSSGVDVASFAVDHVPAGTPAIPLATFNPPIGAKVEVCGYGGPGKQSQADLRHFTSSVLKYETNLGRLSASLLNGDSGGPVIYQGYLVGINSGGSNVRSFGLNTNGSDWMLHSPARITTIGPIRQVLGWQLDPNCPNGQCAPAPRYQQPSNPQWQQQPNFRPPVQPIPVAPVLPNPLRPQTPMAPVLPSPPPVHQQPQNPAQAELKLQQQLDQINELVGAMQKPQALPSVTPLESPQPTRTWTDTAWDLVPWAVVAAGVSVPGGGLFWAGMSLWRMRKKRKPKQAGVQVDCTSVFPEKPVRPSPVQGPVVAVENPPPPQVVRSETQYISYETDTHAKAYQWSKDQVVRKYPGTSDAFQYADSLINQYIKAESQES